MPVFFALGFRPFFLLAGMFAILLMAVWLAAFVGGFGFDTYYGQIGWHSHEMIFGYAVAVIAGFLLTPVRNWTSKATPSGISLAGMALLWLVARILPFFSDIFPNWSIALIDLAFLPALAVGIGVPLVRSGEKRNLIFLPLLATFWAADFLVHAELLGFANIARKRNLSWPQPDRFVDRGYGGKSDSVFHRTGAHRRRDQALADHRMAVAIQCYLFFSG